MWKGSASTHRQGRARGVRCRDRAAAVEAGLPFSYEEGKAYVTEGIELSDETLDAVARGGCFIVGYDEDIDACIDESLGMTACSFIGVGVLTTNGD